MNSAVTFLTGFNVLLIVFNLAFLYIFFRRNYCALGWRAKLNIGHSNMVIELQAEVDAQKWRIERLEKKVGLITDSMTKEKGPS